MKTRHGEGSIYYSERDQRWEFKVTVQGKTHKRTGKTKAKLLDRIREFEETGIVDHRKMTVGALLDAHLADMKERLERGTRKSSTVAFNAERIGNLKAALGHIKVVDLKAHHVERMMDGLPGGSSYKKQHRAILRCALNRIALKNGVVSVNVAGLAEPPEKETRRDLSPPTEEEMARIIELEEIPFWKALWALMAGCGLRPHCEAAAVKWSWFSVEEDGWWLTLADSKTEEGKKPIPVPQSVMDLIFTLPNDSEYVFSSNRTGGVMNPRWILTQWHRACERAGVKRCGIDLIRKYACTRWAKIAREEQLKRLARHTDTRTTRQFYVKPGTEGLREITG